MVVLLTCPLFLTQFDDDIDSFLFVPVKKSDSVYGIICLFNKVNSDFNENDKFVIESALFIYNPCFG